MEELEKQEIVTIEYTYPKFWHRVMANLIDILIFAVTAVALFIGVRAIVVNTPNYKALENYVDQTRLDSQLYVKSEKNILSLTSYLEDNKNIAPSVKNLRSQSAIDGFIDYIRNNFGDEKANLVQEDYDSFRLNDSLTYAGVKYFTKEEGKIKYNPDCSADAKTYYSNVYYPYLTDHCQSFLISINTQYASSAKEIGTYLLWLEIPVSYIIAAVLTYFVPPLFFKRGRKTLGKAIYHIGLVDKTLFSPKLGRYALRFIIFLFGELILSLATFGIPFIISFSLMAFSKRRQGFPDYMLAMVEIDTSKNNIYMDKVEAELTLNPVYKPPVDFNLINKE